MGILICLAGIPSSGKTTFSRTFNLPVISTDLIRKELYGNQECYYQEEIAMRLINEKGINCSQIHLTELKRIKKELCLNYVFETARQRARQLLQDGYDVVYDSTNLMRRYREKLLQETSDVTQACDLYYMNTSFKDVLKRNQNRIYKIEETMLQNLFKTQQLPSYEEGYRYLYEVDKRMNVKLLDKEMKIIPCCE